MTIDSHSYLVSRGWKGKGNALKEGGRSRPVIQAQKKDQKGLGKNRDDGFQFWDHVYAAAADAIKIHVDDSEDGDDRSNFATRADSAKQGTNLTVTHTGILSNRRPIDFPNDGNYEPRVVTRQNGVDLLVLAKREAAKRELYSRFYRGGIVNQEEERTSNMEKPMTDRGETATQEESSGLPKGTDEKLARKQERKKIKEEKRAHKKRKLEDEESGTSTKRQRGP